MSIRSSIKPHVNPDTWAVLRRMRKSLTGADRAVRDRLIYLMNRTQKCQVHGLEIRLKISNSLEKYRARTYSTKEPETLDWLDKNLKPQDVLFDIGANIGLYSLYAAKLQPKATVYGFEPESQNFAHFCQNIFINKLDNLFPCSFPLTDTDTFDYFHLSEFTVGSSLHGFGQLAEFGIDHEARPTLRQGALGVSVDIVIDRYKLPSPQLIKVDVDGIEEKIVDGMAKTLAKGGVRTLLIEVTDTKTQVSPIEAQLKEYGYLVTLRGRQYDYGQHLCQNLIFEKT